MIGGGEEVEEKRRPERRHNLDWLRVLATFGVVFFHVMRFFNAEPWEVKNNITSEVVDIFIALFAQWMMPIFFTISGAAIYYSLGIRKPDQFIRARINRILIPFLTVGLFVLVPPQEYIKAVTRGSSLHIREMGFFEIYPLYLSNISILRGEFPYIYIPAMHLWYLEYLFLFSLILLPLFTYLRSPRGQARITQLAEATGGTISIYILALPFGILMSLLDPETPMGNINWFGGWPLLAYPLFLITGFLIHSDKRYEGTMKRQAKQALTLAFLSFPVLGFFYMRYLEGALPFGTVGYTMFIMLRALNSWLFIMGFLGLGRIYLSYTSQFLGYFSEASLPIYMLHQTVIVIIGYYIKDWQMAILPKFVLLLAASFIGILGTYEILIRRFNISRRLFGLKIVKKI